MRDREDFELLKVIDKNLEFVMEELGEDLFGYLNEAEETMTKKYGDSGYTPYAESLGIKSRGKPKKESKPSKPAGPFKSLFKGFGELGSAFGGNKPQKKGNKPKEKPMDPWKKKNEIADAKKSATAKVWLAYKNYKKAHKMITW